MTEKTPGQTKKERLASLFAILDELADVPPGSIQFPIEIGGENFTVSIFGKKEGRIKFGLFINDQKYSRKTLEISSGGFVEEDNEGKIPDFDLTDHEPTFATDSDEEIALMVLEKLADILK
ncbi:MAG TPA: hypothetical protein VJC12_03425 [Candidatus Paceibacterota bacterium]